MRECDICDGTGMHGEGTCPSDPNLHYCARCEGRGTLEGD